MNRTVIVAALLIVAASLSAKAEASEAPAGCNDLRVAAAATSEAPASTPLFAGNGCGC